MSPLSSSYWPLCGFIDRARASNQFWRILLGAFVIVLIYGLWLAGLILFLNQRYGPLLGNTIRDAMFRGRTPGMALLGLFSFFGLALGPIAAVRLVHRRPAGTLFGPAAQVIRDFRHAATGVLALNMIFFALALGDDSLRFGQSPGVFFLHLPLAFACLLIQTGAEELVFRGYLLQQLAARFRAPQIWMLVPTLLFALGHYAPDLSGSAAPYVTVWAILFGLLAADLTARTGSLGAAWGFHFANNAIAMLLINSEGSFSGLSLWVVPAQPMDAGADSLLPSLLVQCASLCCCWLAARIALRR